MRNEKDTSQLVEQLLNQCPYDAETEKNLWIIYNLGLMKTLVARWAQDDWLLKQELVSRLKDTDHK